MHWSICSRLLKHLGIFKGKNSKSPNHGGERDFWSGALQAVAILSEPCSKVERLVSWCDCAGEGGWFAHVYGGVVRGVGVDQSCRSVGGRWRAYDYLLKHYSSTAEVVHLECSLKVSINKDRLIGITQGPDFEHHETMLAS